ncbi:hypothetical protein Tco_0831688, partial [Tanacetum coccineum]
MAYPCLHSPKTTKEQDQYAVSRRSQYAVLKIIFWKISNVVLTPRNPNTPYPTSPDMAYRTDYQTLSIDDPKLSF